MEELAWKYTVWFYNQMGQIYVPSQSIYKELVGKGIEAEKIHLFGGDFHHTWPMYTVTPTDTGNRLSKVI
jgi:hypothetical protein